MANEPTFVDGVEDPARKSIYYHYGLDMGGAEGLVDVVAAADAVVITAGTEGIKSPDLPPNVRPRYDEINLRDGRGWYYCYAHLMSIDPAVKPGAAGQDGAEDRHPGQGGEQRRLVAPALPHPGAAAERAIRHSRRLRVFLAGRITPSSKRNSRRWPGRITWPGPAKTSCSTARLSWSAKGPGHIARYQWILSNDPTVDGPTVTRRYAFGGEFCEILKVTDADGRVDYDFAVVQVRRPRASRASASGDPRRVLAHAWPEGGRRGHLQGPLVRRCAGRRASSGGTSATEPAGGGALRAQGSVRRQIDGAQPRTATPSPRIATPSRAIIWYRCGGPTAAAKRPPPGCASTSNRRGGILPLYGDCPNFCVSKNGTVPFRSRVRGRMPRLHVSVVLHSPPTTR